MLMRSLGAQKDDIGKAAYRQKWLEQRLLVHMYMYIDIDINMLINLETEIYVYVYMDRYRYKYRHTEWRQRGPQRFVSKRKAAEIRSVTQVCALCTCSQSLTTSRGFQKI